MFIRPGSWSLEELNRIDDNKPNRILDLIRTGGRRDAYVAHTGYFIGCNHSTALETHPPRQQTRLFPPPWLRLLPLLWRP